MQVQQCEPVECVICSHCPPPPPCESTTKVANFDGNNTY